MVNFTINIGELKELKKTMEKEPKLLMTDEMVKELISVLNYVISIKHKRHANTRKYRQNKGRSRIALKARERYYLKNDIYHPQYNINGSIEKRIKRPVVV